MNGQEDKNKIDNLKQLRLIKTRLNEISKEISILIDDLSSNQGRKSNSKAKPEHIIELNIIPKIEEILSNFEKFDRDKFRNYLLNYDLTIIKKIISQNGYGIPKVTSKWKNKEKLVDYLIAELEKMSKKGDSLR